MKMFLFLVLSLFATHALALTGTAKFKADTTAVWDFEGSGGKVSGGEVKDGKLQGVFTSSIKDYKTGDDKRDEEMYPLFKDPSVKVEVPAVEAKGKQSAMVKVTINGKTKESKADFDFSPGACKVNFKINYTDFIGNVANPVTLGALRVKDMVDIFVDLKL